MHSSPRSVSASVVLLLLLAAPAFGYRREYVVTYDGARKVASEVCFYGGRAASGSFPLYFTYDRAACLPADQVLDIPPGLFHVFARHGEGFVSGDDDYFVHSGPAAEDGYDKLQITLKQAARADVSHLLATLRPQQKIGVWLAPTETESGTYIPLIDGEKDILVPAGRRFLPLLVAGGLPVALGEPVTLAAGKRAAIPPFDAPRHGSDVVTWLKVDRVSDAEPDRGLQPADISLVAAGETIRPVFAPPAGTGVTHALLFFKGVPSGPAQLLTRGKNWVHSEVEIDTRAAAVTAVAEPLVLIPGATLNVVWDLGVIAEARPCTADDAPAPRIEVSVLDCTSGDCNPLAKRSVPFAASGSIAFEGIPPGDYNVVVHPPFARATSLETELYAGKETTLYPSLEAFRFFGTVTLDGKPVQARLFFESGEAQSDAAGRYSAVLASNPLTNLIGVMLCSDGAMRTYVPRDPIAENAVYDIELSERPLAVTVTGNAGAPVAAASVTFSQIRRQSGSESSVDYSSPPQTTNADGQVTFSRAPAGTPLVVCAEARGYLRACSAAFEITKSATRSTTIALTPSVARGKVAGHDGFGMLFFVAPNGVVTEEVQLAQDGTFDLRQAHTGAEHMVYVSSRRPLTVLPMPNDTSHPELLVTLPSIPSRSFSVTVPGAAGQSGFVGLWIGDRYVPLDALAFHLDHRGIDLSVRGEHPVEFRDITGTGPISVAYAPDPPANGGPFVDPFTLPQYANVRRQLVTASAVTLPAR